MKKIINPCLVEVYEGKKVDAFCEITYEDGNLSICGVIGPKRNGDCYGSCGQCVDEISRGCLLMDGMLKCCNVFVTFGTTGI